MVFISSSSRSPTNQGALIFCIFLIISLFVVVGLCFFDGSIFRLINGFDDCGNICGKINDPKFVKIPGYCKAKDMSSKQFTMIGKEVKVYNDTYFHAVCVDKCGDDYMEIFNRCIEKSKDNKPTNDDDDNDNIEFEVIMSKSWKPIMLSVMVAAVFSFIVLVLFRYFIKQIIWGLYIGFIVICILISICFLFTYLVWESSYDNDKREIAFIWVILAAVFGIIGVVSAVVMYLFRNKIKLVIGIFKETSKVLADISPLLFQPVLTMISTILSFLIFSYFTMIIFSSGKLETVDNEHGKYELSTYKDGPKQYLSMALNAFVYYWFLNFLYACQHFIIASSVSQWYFTQDKTKLRKPMRRAYSHLLRFHIGALCLGSLLITIIKILMMLLRLALSDDEDSSNSSRLLDDCIRSLLDALEKLAEFLLRNAYIVVALKGTSMVPSGKKAAALLKDNLMDVVALNQFGDFVMAMARIIVAFLTGMLCYTLIPDINGQSIGVPGAVIAAVLGLLIIHCFMTVFEMAVDTIFICFCVDCEENDGVNQQYYMSPKLMKTMEKIKSFTGGLKNFKKFPSEGQPLNPYPGYQTYPPQDQSLNASYAQYSSPTYAPGNEMNKFGVYPLQDQQMNTGPSYSPYPPQTINTVGSYHAPSFNNEMNQFGAFPPHTQPPNPGNLNYPPYPTDPSNTQTKLGFNV